MSWRWWEASSKADLSFLVYVSSIIPYLVTTVPSSIPAILLIVVLILIFCFRNDCTRLVPPKTVSDAGQRDEGAKSSVSIRCSQISEKHGLTRRETEVLVLLAEGRNEPYIEDVLGISRTTVKTHITHIYRKVGVSSRQGLLDVLWE